MISNINVFACLNGEHYILKNQSILYQDREDKLPFGHDFYIEAFNDNISELDSLYKKTKDLDYLSDKGLILILQKKYDEAIKLYEFIEKTEPNRYSTASNLGTIYELIGDNQKALLWINKSIEINPKSHEGSEWLHVKILEAKIKGDKFYTGEFLLGVNFGIEEKPNSNLSRYELSNLGSSLYYQLNERISFINPKDPIIAVLLFELGNIQLLKDDFTSAYDIYLKAQEYGYHSETIEARLAFIKNRKDTAKSPSITDNSNLFFFLIAIALIATIVAILIFAKKRRT